jgi:hypothetical protein
MALSNAPLILVCTVQLKKLVPTIATAMEHALMGCASAQVQLPSHPLARQKHLQMIPPLAQGEESYYRLKNSRK